MFVRAIPRHRRDVLAADVGRHVHRVVARFGALPANAADRVEHLVGQATVRLVAETRVGERLAQLRGDRPDLSLHERIEVPEDETRLFGRVERDPGTTL